MHEIRHITTFTLRSYLRNSSNRFYHRLCSLLLDESFSIRSHSISLRFSLRKRMILWVQNSIQIYGNKHTPSQVNEKLCIRYALLVGKIKEEQRKFVSGLSYTIDSFSFTMHYKRLIFLLPPTSLLSCYPRKRRIEYEFRKMILLLLKVLFYAKIKRE